MIGDRFVHVRGVDLAVSRVGSGTPVVWGHGFTSSRAHEDDLGLLAPQLPADRYELIRYDARGHGDSEGSTDSVDYEYPNLGRDQLALAAALGHGDYIAGGASMGSVTSLWAAVHAPERVRALVIAIPPTAWEARGDRGALYQAGADLIAAEGMEPIADLAAAEPPPELFAHRAEEWVEGRQRQYLALNADTMPATFRGIGSSDLPAREQVAALTMPALVLAWAGDPVHPAATAEEVAALIPTSELHVADRVDDVTGWSDLIVEFLDRSLSR